MPELPKWLMVPASGSLRQVDYAHLLDPGFLYGGSVGWYPPMTRMPGQARPGLRAWSFVLAFGWVSLLGDFVYEGARSITGPLLLSLGASAVTVGVVTGAGEAAALLLRLVSGPLADRTGRFWALAISGYILTVVSVPLLGFSAVLWIAVVLVIAERVGKALRSPAKDTMISHATSSIGRGKGFAVQEALDQIGALLGPLAVAAMLILTSGDYGPSLAVLAIPGGAMIVVLFWLRARVPATEHYELTVTVPDAAPERATHSETAVPLPTVFWRYALFTGLTVSGFATFGVLSFHIVDRAILPVAAVPLIYAAVMGVDALAALGTGWMYDRTGPRVVLIFLPLIAGLIPFFSYTENLPAVIIGALLWGCAMGIQESTLRATVADLIGPGRRATAYGILAAIIGAGALAGGALAGFLYERSIPLLIVVTVLIQLAALVLFVSAGLMRRDRVVHG